MAYCVSCGGYEPFLHPHDLCASCFGLFTRHELNLKQLDAVNRVVEKTLTKPLLSYLHDLELFRGPHSPVPPLMANQNPYDRQMPDQEIPRHPQEISGNNAYPPQSPYNPLYQYGQRTPPLGVNRGYGYPTPIPGYLLRKSTFALVFMILGLFMPVYIGLPLEIAAVGLAISARRTEPRNWRQMFALIGALFIIGMLILALYLASIYPEMFEGTGLTY